MHVSSVAGAVVSGTRTARVTIADDDPTPTLTIGNVPVKEGDTASTPVTLTLSAARRPADHRG